MSAELLREAAAKMRERAEAGTPGPWRPNDASDYLKTIPTWEVIYTAPDDDPFVAGEDVALANYVEQGDAEHIASWHPAVAHAVAKAMDDVAQAWEIADGWALDPDDDPIRFEETLDGGWVAVARAYLGRDA